MKKLIIMLLALAATTATLKAQQVSGKVMDADGAVTGASVSEIDKIGRSVNQVITNDAGIFVLPLRNNKNRIRVFKDGYREVVEPINGRLRVNITLAQHRQHSINTLQTVKKPKGEDTRELIEAHGAKGQSVEQWVRLEQLTDTSFIFAIAFSVPADMNMYPAGRGLLFLDIADRKLLRARCVADAHPVMSMETAPDFGEIIHDVQEITTSASLDYAEKSHKGTNQRYWLVPCFEISDKNLETLYAKGRDVIRLAIEMPGAEGFWFVYPKEGWVDQLRTLISRIRPNR